MRHQLRSTDNDKRWWFWQILFHFSNQSFARDESQTLFENNLNSISKCLLVLSKHRDRSNEIGFPGDRVRNEWTNEMPLEVNLIKISNLMWNHWKSSILKMLSKWWNQTDEACGKQRWDPNVEYREDGHREKERKNERKSLWCGPIYLNAMIRSKSNVKYVYFIWHAWIQSAEISCSDFLNRDKSPTKSQKKPSYTQFAVVNKYTATHWIKIWMKWY